MVRTFDGISQSGVGVKNGVDRLTVFYASNVGLVDVDFDFVGLHVHDSGDAGACEAAARGNGGDHFSDLSVFGNDDPREGRLDRAIVDGLLGYLYARLGSSNLGLGEIDLGLKAVGVRAGVVELFLRLHAGLVKLLGAAQFNLGIAELHAKISDGGLGGDAIGPGGIQRSFGVGIIERGEELAFLDPSTLIEENAGDAPGDLGSDGGATAGGDVAASIQQGFAATCTRRLVHGGYFNDGLGLPKREDGAGDAAENDQSAEKDG